MAATTTTSSRPSGSGTSFWSKMVDTAAETIQQGAKVLPTWFADQLGLQKKDQLANPTQGTGQFNGSQTGTKSTLDGNYRETGFGAATARLDGMTIALIGGAALIGVILLVKR